MCSVRDPGHTTNLTPNSLTSFYFLIPTHFFARRGENAPPPWLTASHGFPPCQPGGGAPGWPPPRPHGWNSGGPVRASGLPYRRANFGDPWGPTAGRTKLARFRSRRSVFPWGPGTRSFRSAANLVATTSAPPRTTHRPRRPFNHFFRAFERPCSFLIPTSANRILPASNARHRGPYATVPPTFPPQGSWSKIHRDQRGEDRFSSARPSPSPVPQLPPLLRHPSRPMPPNKLPRQRQKKRPSMPGGGPKRARARPAALLRIRRRNRAQAGTIPTPSHRVRALGPSNDFGINEKRAHTRRSPVSPRTDNNPVSTVANH